MEKTITALFDTSEEVEAARASAREGGAAAEKISVCRAYEPRPFAGKNTLAGIGVGAAAGTVAGLGASVLSGAGMTSWIGPLTGLIGGAVAGAIIGGFLDLNAAHSEPQRRWLFTVSTDENLTGPTAKRLKRCGGERVSVE